MTSFQEISEELLALGLQQTSSTFRDAQRAYILSCQHPDGGFCSPAGDVDLYYTEFAIRSLLMLECDPAPLRLAAAWLTCQTQIPDEVHCFSYLNSRHLLASQDISIPPLPSPLPPLATHSLYRLLLGILCRSLLGTEVDASVAAHVAALQQPDGGFAESADLPQSQTNATAAAIAVFLHIGQMDHATIAPACDYLALRQSPDGGLVAHPAIQCGDLLSSFTAFLALAALGKASSLPDLPALARFLRGCCRSPGGFAAEPRPALQPDVEYTYYGLGLTALLRSISS